MPDFDRGTVDANGLEFHYLEAGSGPLALCVHGFPDSPWTYRYLLPELAKAGYRAVSAFNRGFAPTELPADRHHIHTSMMVADVLALHEALGGGRDAVLSPTTGARSRRGARRAGAGPLGAVRDPQHPAVRDLRREHPDLRPDQALVLLLVLPAAAGHRDGRSRRTTSSSSTASGATGRRATTRARTCRWSRTASATPEHLQAALGYYWGQFDPTRFGSPEWAAEQAAAWGYSLRSRRSTCTARRTAATA